MDTFRSKAVRRAANTILSQKAAEGRISYLQANLNFYHTLSWYDVVWRVTDASAGLIIQGV